MVRKPAVFLFDEPLSNLDAKLRVQMRAQIKQLQNQLKTTSVYVTHDQVEAMTMGHRIAVMERGKLRQVGTPLEVYERPANLFVAGFLGAPPMNLIPAMVSPDGTTIAASGWTFPVPEAYRGAPGLGGRSIVAGIRPESVLGPGKDPPCGAIRLEGTAEMFETLGAEVIVHGMVGRDILVFKADPHSAPGMGARMDLYFSPESLHLFDGETGERLAPSAGEPR
jgi:multiple sugar transport system ATP-binding protein